LSVFGEDDFPSPLRPVRSFHTVFYQNIRPEFFPLGGFPDNPGDKHFLIIRTVKKYHLPPFRQSRWFATENLLKSSALGCLEAVNLQPADDADITCLMAVFPAASWLENQKGSLGPRWPGQRQQLGRLHGRGCAQLRRHQLRLLTTTPGRMDDDHTCQS